MFETTDKEAAEGQTHTDPKFLDFLAMVTEHPRQGSLGLMPPRKGDSLVGCGSAYCVPSRSWCLLFLCNTPRRCSWNFRASGGAVTPGGAVFVVLHRTCCSTMTKLPATATLGKPPTRPCGLLWVSYTSEKALTCHREDLAPFWLVWSWKHIRARFSLSEFCRLVAHL